MQDEKPEQSALLWKKSSGISGKCSAAVCARILYLYEIPKSPCSALPAQRIYCTEMGSFSPNFSSAHALSSGVIFSTRSP